MPNGKRYDNPVTDLLHHGLHPFPEDMEQVIRRIADADSSDPSILTELGYEPFAWEKGEKLDEGREHLGRLLKRVLAKD